MTQVWLTLAACLLATAAIFCRLVLHFRHRQVLAGGSGETGKLDVNVHAAHRPPVNSRRWRFQQIVAYRHPVTGLTKTEAEDLLDWLEAHGQTGRLSYQEGRGFTVQ